MFIYSYRFESRDKGVDVLEANGFIVEDTNVFLRNRLVARLDFVGGGFELVDMNYENLLEELPGLAKKIVGYKFGSFDEGRAFFEDRGDAVIQISDHTFAARPDPSKLPYKYPTMGGGPEPYFFAFLSRGGEEDGKMMYVNRGMFPEVDALQDKTIRQLRAR